MRNGNTRQCQVFTNVCEFAAIHPDVYPPESRGRQLVTELEAVVRDVANCTVTQTSEIGSTRGMTPKAQARKTLRESLTTMAATARGIAVTVPEIHTKFRLPGNLSDAELRNAARTFINNAAPLADVFVSFGLPPTFMEDLTAQVNAFERAAADHKNHQTAHIAATSEIGKLCEKGRAILHQLDPVTLNSLGGNTLLTARWNCSRRADKRTAARTRPEPPTGTIA